MSQLPIQAVMPELLAGVQAHPQMIVKAAPGAGKSTHFPLQLLKAQLFTGKIIMLEPRRLAARSIACYLAQQLGESVGQTVGYRMRGESKVSAATQLEIVTEGIMTRMIQTDPELSGIDLLIFDEYHERSIHADTALALSLEVQSALREDLKIVVMSATLDQLALQSLLPQALYVQSEGRAYPVEVRYAPLRANDYLVPTMSKQIEGLMRAESGSLLAFLPGVSAIKQLEQQLAHLADEFDICPLYGQLSLQAQQKAIAPAVAGKRKIVLATNIAETSLTIEGIRLVVDAGLERIAKFDLKTGITRLEQVKIAQSSAQQRTGRGGRLESGICLRLYSEAQYKQQPQVPSAEILHSDLAPLAMELAQWGVVSVNDLPWLDTPPPAAMQQAWSLLHTLGLMDSKQQLSALGKKAQSLGVEPRLVSMLLKAHETSDSMLNTALAVTALLEEPERNVLDLQHSLMRWQQATHPKTQNLHQRATTLARALGGQFQLTQVDESLLALVLSLAFPDRIAQRRSESQRGQFLLANGHGAQMRDDERLAGAHYLVVVDLMRSGSQASQIFVATELDIDALQAHFSELFSTQERVDWDEKAGKLCAERLTLCGKLVIEREALPEPAHEKMTQALLNYVRRKGLSVLQWSEAASALLTRIRCAAQWLPEAAWPAVEEQALLDDLEIWLAPYLVGVKSVKALAKVPIFDALNAYLGWPLNQEIDRWLPTHHPLPTGNRAAIRYQLGAEPMLSVRMQEMFGEQDSPTIAQGRKKVVMELLSPAQRPLQVTQDLAGFWQGAYKEVQKEMKGRYPKHVWPDDPANHIATTKTKRQLAQ